MELADRMKRVAVTEQNPVERAKNFKEVCLGYDNERAVKEASRCLHCKNPKCVEGCPVSINIPEFISHIKENDIEGAAKEIAKYSSLPAVCGRVCPQESQCEGKCVLGIKGEPIAIGKLEKYAADWARENNVDNVEFFVGESEVVIPDLINKGVKADIVVVDPPRKGCDVKLLNAITNIDAERIVYVSCDPSTLARDLAILEENGYETLEVQPVDMFPQTAHIENVALLIKER